MSLVRLSLGNVSGVAEFEDLVASLSWETLANESVTGVMDNQDQETLAMPGRPTSTVPSLLQAHSRPISPPFPGSMGRHPFASSVLTVYIPETSKREVSISYLALGE